MVDDILAIAECDELVGDPQFFKVLRNSVLVDKLVISVYHFCVLVDSLEQVALF